MWTISSPYHFWLRCSALVEYYWLRFSIPSLWTFSLLLFSSWAWLRIVSERFPAIHRILIISFPMKSTIFYESPAPPLSYRPLKDLKIAFETIFDGQGWIRTTVQLYLTKFTVSLLQPLGHLPVDFLIFKTRRISYFNLKDWCLCCC